MKTKFLIKLGVISLFLISTQIAMGQTSTSNPKRIIKRTDNSGSTGRPKMPAISTDFLTYTLAGNLLQVDYPANSLPATVVIKNEQSGFVCYSTTAVTAEPLELTTVTPGDYVLTVTLVDNRIYSGSLEVE